MSFQESLKNKLGGELLYLKGSKDFSLELLDKPHPHNNPYVLDVNYSNYEYDPTYSTGISLLGGGEFYSIARIKSLGDFEAFNNIIDKSDEIFGKIVLSNGRIISYESDEQFADLIDDEVNELIELEMDL